ncbi:hypothetical protein AYI70_g8484 [Smittium culicis]|uniref:Uncharacterized protein n=1 Tax=Smittium culicis TaxID=133412 RepID=A0A1R1XFP4_9FUNG|nr:hypothetical protein AYI70_g8484 [Smittium culicis]
MILAAFIFFIELLSAIFSHLGFGQISQLLYSIYCTATKNEKFEQRSASIKKIRSLRNEIRLVSSVVSKNLPLKSAQILLSAPSYTWYASSSWLTTTELPPSISLPPGLTPSPTSSPSPPLPTAQSAPHLGPLFATEFAPASFPL